MKYFIKKVLTLIITLFIVSLLAFLAFSVISGDPVTKMLGTEATPEAIAALRETLGLNGNVFARYFRWLGNFLKGDFGISYSYNMPVGEMISGKLVISAVLMLISFAITLIVSIPAGIAAGTVKTPWLDKTVSIVNQAVMSVPAFFTGIIACYLFGLVLKVFTPGDFVSYTVSIKNFLLYLIFPALSIALPRIAMTVKMLRSSIQTELAQDYVRTAVSRGCRKNDILFRHVLRNAMIPVTTFLAVSLAEIMTGSIIIEQVFSVPGIGRLLLSSINNRDFPVVQAIVVIMAAWIVTVNFAADMINRLADPRIGLQ